MYLYSLYTQTFITCLIQLKPLLTKTHTCCWVPSYMTMTLVSNTNNNGQRTTMANRNNLPSFLVLVFDMTYSTQSIENTWLKYVFKCFLTFIYFLFFLTYATLASMWRVLPQWKSGDSIAFNYYFLFVWFFIPNIKMYTWEKPIKLIWAWLQPICSYVDWNFYGKLTNC